MKRRILSVICALLTLISSVLFPAAVFAAQEINFSVDHITVNAGSSKTVSVIANCTKQNPEDYNWSSSNPQTVVVSNGKITGLRRGKTIVTAVKKGSKKVYAQCTVNVTADYNVNPQSAPYKNKYISYRTYNEKTKQYYMLRSYLERLEATNGGTLTLEAGEYDVTNVLYLASNITVKLSDGVVLNKTDDTVTKKLIPSQSLFQVVAPSQAELKHNGYNGAKNVKILGEGDSVIDMSQTGNDKKYACIVAGHCKNITVRGIKFKNLQYGNFIEAVAASNVYISKCSFVNNESILEKIVSFSDDGKDNMGVSGINIDAPNRRTGSFTQSWTSYDCTPCKSITVEECKFKNVSRGVESDRYTENKAHTNIKVSKCRFDSITSYAVYMLNWQSPVITENKVSSCGTGDAGIKGMSRAVVGQGVSSPIIADNEFENCESIMRFTPALSSCGYTRIDNSITKEEYQRIADSNYSVNNSYKARALSVSQGFLKNGKPNYKSVYPKLHFAEKTEER